MQAAVYIRKMDKMQYTPFVTISVINTIQIIRRTRVKQAWEVKMRKMYNRMFVEIIHECNTRKEFVLPPESKLIVREHHYPDTTINFYVPNSTEG